MTGRKRKALSTYRRRLKQGGLVRLEVHARKDDAPLVRGVVEALGDRRWTRIGSADGKRPLRLWLREFCRKLVRFLDQLTDAGPPRESCSGIGAMFEGILVAERGA